LQSLGLVGVCRLVDPLGVSGPPINSGIAFSDPPRPQKKDPQGGAMVTKSPQSGPRGFTKTFVYWELQEGVTIV
jgi:hypothetical protein